MTHDIAGTGSMVADAITLTSRIIGPEEKALLLSHQDGATTHRFVGGVTLNHLGWAALLGVDVAIFGKQADDEAGRFLRAGMDRAGISWHLDLSGKASSEANIFVAPDGGRAIYMARGATGEFTADEVDEHHLDVINGARFVTTEVSQLPLSTVLRVLERAKEAGATTVLDLDVPLVDTVPALGSLDELHQVLSLVDVLKPSLAAVGEHLVPGTEAGQVARALGDRYGCRLVAVTDGEAGSVLWDGSLLHRVPSRPIQVVDTTGAGDAFLGGLVAGLCMGLSPVDSARLGNACGAACCEQLGAFPEPMAECRVRVQALYGETLPTTGPPIRTDPKPDPVAAFLINAAATTLATAEGVDRQAIAAAVELIGQVRSTGGRVHVTGVGKTAYLAGYAASLMSSTGTPATFLHGTEATHGSVGQLEPGDVVVAISNSGNTRELVASVQACRARQAIVIAVTGHADSQLATEASIVLLAPISCEGGPLDLAPRASILAQATILMALSVGLQQAAGLSRSDYNQRHPGGNLGKRSAEPDNA
jgi:arabinose-5-phosphate isomerase